MRKVQQLLLLLSLAFIIIFYSLSCTTASKKNLNPPAPSAPPPSPKIETVDRKTNVTEAEIIRAESSLPARELQEKSNEEDIQENGNSADEVYALYQEAQAAMEKGNMDEALQLLDKAYAALLKIEAPGDSPLSQEKYDLRILLAQKIQQVYAFRLPPPGSNHKTIPLVENSWVQAEIKSFQTVERKFFEEAYRRSGLYRPMILEELRRAGLPEELSWLPLIESGYKARALSRARALGLWQFIASTGYRYGLKRDKYVDERMDPVKSTQAAIKYLTELHDFFGDWSTAIAAYNCGEIRVQNVIRAQKIDYLDNFWDLFTNLPYETARYVPRFIATLLIIENPEKYGFSLPEPEPALNFETVRINKPVKLSVIASKLSLNPDLLVQLNPELRHDSTPNYEYELKVPAGFGDLTLACLNELPSWTPPDVVYGWHTVKKGETLGAIARRYRTSVQAIVRLNRLKSATLIYPGQRLRIPGKGQGLEPGEGDDPITPARQTDASAGLINYTVKPGDSLYQIARTFGVSVEKIKKDNGLDSDLLSVGQKLIIKKN
ncbi:MAG: LysM peptidoglycan-binding domain-containing protein [Candidatus Saccharicenans sp.]